MLFIKKHFLLLIFILGLFLRLAFIFGSYAFDVNNHIVWAQDLQKYGFIDFFSKQSSQAFAVKLPNYPPLSLFIFYLFYPLPKIIFDFFWFLNVNIPLFPSSFLTLLEGIDKRLFIAAMLKLPAIIADLGLAFMLTLFIEKINLNKNHKKKNNLKLFVASLILFNPVFIYNSSIWGQIDSIPLLFLIVSVYFLLFSNKDILSGMLFVLSLLVKPTTVIFIPVYGIVFINRFGLLKSLRTLFFLDLLFLLSFFPFIGKIDLFLPYKIYWNNIVLAQSIPYVTNGAFNFWMIIIDFKKGIVDTSPYIFNLSYRLWGYLLTGILLTIILFKLLKEKINKKKVLYYFFFSTVIAILFLTKMHERYFLLPLPFLLLLTVDNKKNLKYFIFFSLFAFLNHYQSWSNLPIDFISKILNNSYFLKIVSITNILIFLRFVKINSCKL